MPGSRRVTRVGGALFWTVRNAGATPRGGLSLRVDAAALGLAAGAHRVTELTKSVAWPSESAALVVAAGEARGVGPECGPTSGL